MNVSQSSWKMAYPLTMLYSLVGPDQCVAVLAIIVFGDIAVATDSISDSFICAVITAITAWMFSSNGLRIAENAAQDIQFRESRSKQQQEKMQSRGRSTSSTPWQIQHAYRYLCTKQLCQLGASGVTLLAPFLLWRQSSNPLVPNGYGF
jgi:hypothetical protein